MYVCVYTYIYIYVYIYIYFIYLFFIYLYREQGSKSKVQDNCLRQTKDRVRREKKVCDILELTSDQVKFEYVQRQ